MGAEHNYFTYKFLTDHVALLGPYDKQREAKKKAEVRYQKRSVPVNTLLCLWPRDLTRLIGEVLRRQEEYAANPNGLFVSEAAYSYSPRQFRYGVRRENPKELFKIHHLDGIV